MRAGEIAGWLGAPIEGDPELEITAAAALETAGAGDISFVGRKKAQQLAAASGAGCLLAGSDFDNAAGRTLIRVADPRAAFARVVMRLHPPRPVPPGIHPTAVIGPRVELGAEVSIGAHATLAEGARIGERTVVGAGCAVGRGTTIGTHGRLAPNVTIYDDCEIGDRVVIHSGAVIGADGFGFVMAGDHYEKFPQVGRVSIGDDVEIGANTCIDRAALGVTVIGDGAKLDNMVHIAHNCAIGRHVVIAAQTGLSGGVIVEDYAVIGGQVGIGDKVRVESKAVLGSGSGVLTSKIVRGGNTYWGTPARPLKEYLEQLANMGRVGELRKQVAMLVERIEELERADRGGRA
ncbi:MAG: UDP-3-O-(3-hydroxymyristoyl)glucosamine N-acyltransferase [Bryobacteraceae bacterium]